MSKKSKAWFTGAGIGWAVVRGGAGGVELEFLPGIKGIVISLTGFAVWYRDMSNAQAL